jgi:hypothetical protein
LNEKKRQQTRRNPLRKVELEAPNPVQPKGHRVQWNRFQSKLPNRRFPLAGGKRQVNRMNNEAA